MLLDSLKRKLINPNYSFLIGEDIYGRFRFPFDVVKSGSTIIIYGGGVVGKTFLQQIAKSSYCTIRAVCDQYPGRTNIVEVPVISIAELSGMSEDEYDLVVVACENRNISIEIRQNLVLAGIDDRKIFWGNPAADDIKCEHKLEVSVLDKEMEMPQHAKQMTAVSTRTWMSRKGMIYMDTSRISIEDWGTGIQRTVNNLYTKMLGLGGNIYPIKYECDLEKFTTSHKYKCRMENTVFDGLEHFVSMSNQDTLLFTDSSWDFEDKVLLCAKDSGAKICTLIYDLIPILTKDSHPESVRKTFKKWIHAALLYSDSILCITQTVADDVIQYCKENNFNRQKSLDIHVIHLGCEIEQKKQIVRENISNFVENSRTFLMVGTVEIRKNHSVALEAFRRIYSENPNEDIQLLILGRRGWMIDEFQDLLMNEKCLQGHVLWVQDANDGEVQWAYNHCSALIYPSKIEGLGLPLLEAAHFNLPILCSDIPVFHEIVGENGDYFKVNDAESLKAEVLKWLSMDEHPESNKIERYLWEDTAREVLDILQGKAMPYYSIRPEN